MLQNNEWGSEVKTSEPNDNGGRSFVSKKMSL